MRPSLVTQIRIELLELSCRVTFIADSLLHRFSPASGHRRVEKDLAYYVWHICTVYLHQVKSCSVTVFRVVSHNTLKGFKIQ